MPEHYGAWSLLPPLLAIGLAMITRWVAASIFCGVVAGALILAQGEPTASLRIIWLQCLWPTITNQDNQRVLAFTLLLGAMIGVIHHAGGMLGLVDTLRPWARTRRRGQLTGWLLGLVIFFDDYANTLLLGTTLRPVTDRLKISREKLAYIVDSTAAPVASIALLSTWVAFEISYIQKGFEGLQLATAGEDAFRVFVATIVYRFYPLLALLMVGLVAWSGRDFGPMLEAERRALRNTAGGGADEAGHTHSRPARQRRWYVAVVPVSVVLVVLLLLLYWTGSQEKGADATLWQVIVAGDSFLSLVWASACGLLVASVMAWSTGGLAARHIWNATVYGGRLMLPALIVLWLAWSLADIISSPGADGVRRLGTAAYLSGMISDRLAPEWLPTVVFILSSLVAYCTGTSWATMSILTPLVIESSWKILAAGDQSPTLDHPILMAAIGSVLAGSIFGDHCSPISDTTVLSSRASQCDHVAHVWTQMPYALTVAAVSIVCGTIPVGFGWSVWLALPMSAGALLAVLLLCGRSAEDQQGEGREA
ncbi:MAG: Na+/H+ antiporter NhaC family protein [Planctomycetota bacterium]|nr:Na+/H+ antiporter NhaC family protein [Planctomycetota bacterium]